MTLYIRGFSRVVTFPTAPIATGRSDPCRKGLAPSQEPCLSTAHAHVCSRPAIIVDLCDAAAFIDMHGGRTQLWLTAETAVKCVDHSPRLIEQATRSLENALRREGMLD
jgi:hypothetical protein